MNRPNFVRLVRSLVFKKNGQVQDVSQYLDELCPTVRFVRALVKRTGGQAFAPLGVMI